MKIFTAIAAFLGLLTEAIQEYRRRKRLKDAQASSDSIDFDPTGDLMRKFKRGQVQADTAAKPRKHDEE